MSAEIISLQELLQHAAPNSPLALLRDEARQLVEDSVYFAEDVTNWMVEHFERSNERNQYKHDEDD